MPAMLHTPFHIQRKKHIAVVGAVFAVAGIAALIWGWRTTTYASVELNAMQWGKAPNIVAISNMQRENRLGILLLKLKNGQEQFIAGSWTVDFTDEGNLFAFGEFPPNYSEQQGQQLYYISNDDKVYNLVLSDLKGTITSVQENPKMTYMLIESRNDTSSTYCVAELKEGNTPTCNTLNTPGKAKALWNPEKDHEAIIKNEAGEIFLFDPWERTPKSVDKEAEQDLYRDLDGLLQTKPRDRVVHTQNDGDRVLYQVLNIVVVRDDHGWTFARIPAFSSAAWLADGKHLLIKQKDAMSIYELKTRTLARVIAESRIGKHGITFRNTEYDQTL